MLASVVSYNMECGYGRNVAVDNLSERDVTAVCGKVEALRLNAGAVHGVPFHVITSELSVWGCLCLLGDSANVGWAIDWLFCADGVGKAV